MKKIHTLTGIAVFMAVAAQAATTFLGDINGGSGPTATVADFTAMGVLEDLTGATVVGMNTSVSGGGVSIASSNNYSGNYQQATGNNLERDYVHIRNDQDPWQSVITTLTISGLTDTLDASTTYAFYLFGKGGANEFSTFDFGGDIKTTTELDPSVRYEFTTAATVADTLILDWTQGGTSKFAPMNGIAFVAIPEPSSAAAIFGLVGAFAMIQRRKRS